MVLKGRNMKLQARHVLLYFTTYVTLYSATPRILSQFRGSSTGTLPHFDPPDPFLKFLNKQSARHAQFLHKRREPPGTAKDKASPAAPYHSRIPLCPGDRTRVDGHPPRCKQRNKTLSTDHLKSGIQSSARLSHSSPLPPSAARQAS